jgi:hypothetical protein
MLCFLPKPGDWLQNGPPNQPGPRGVGFPAANIDGWAASGSRLIHGIAELMLAARRPHNIGMARRSGQLSHQSIPATVN